MTTTQPSQPQEQENIGLSCMPAMSTLWVPPDATIQQWADFGKEAITVPALVATGTAFYALSWETKALRHYTLACQERERGRRRKLAHWLGRAMQDLDCAIDQWQQALAWLHLASNDKRQDPASLEAMRSLMEQASEHQERRQALHRQVQQELMTIAQRNQQQKRYAHGKEESADASVEDTHASS